MILFTAAAGFAVTAAFNAALACASVYRSAVTALRLPLAVGAEYLIVEFFNKLVKLLSAV